MSSFDKDYKEAQLRRLQDEIRDVRHSDTVMAFVAGVVLSTLMCLAYLNLIVPAGCTG